MNVINFTGIRISRRDYFRLPDHLRVMAEEGPMILSKVNGSETFVDAIIID